MHDRRHQVARALMLLLALAGLSALVGFGESGANARPAAQAEGPLALSSPTGTPTATITPHAGCCTEVAVQAFAECVPNTPDLYLTSYTLTNSCPTTQVATRTYYFEVAPTSGGPWDVVSQSGASSRSYPPGDTNETYYFGIPVYEPYYWFRMRVVVIEQTTCWIREAASTPALLCAGPSPTPTNTRTPTATPTTPPCEVYGYTISTGTITSGTALVTGSQCGHCTVQIGLPFPFTFYDQTYSSAYLGNYGTMQFASNYVSNTNACPMPYPDLGPAILPHWDVWLGTAWHTSCEQYLGSPCGIYTSVTGVAPNRVFNIEWRAQFVSTSQHTANFEVRLYEGTGHFDFVYGHVSYIGGSAVVGVQDGESRFTPYECQTWGSLNAGMLLAWNPPSCSLSPTPTATWIPTATVTPTPAGATLVGHVTYQGIDQPSTRNMQPITLTLCIQGAPQDFVRTTDSQGFFTVTLSTLNPSNTYNYRVKSYKNLANAGTDLPVPPGSTTSMELGLLKAADSDNNNTVNASDFNRLKADFGTPNSPFTDFNNDGITNSTDFNLLRGNFGVPGASLTCP